MSKTIDTPCVWVGCMACYNEGRLVGRWYPIDEAEGVTIEELHGEVPVGDHEEMWVYDTENIPTKTEFDVYGATLWAESWKELGADLWEPFGLWVDDNGEEPDAWERFKNSYQGQAESLGAWVRDNMELFFAKDQRRVLDEVGDYVDWDKYAAKSDRWRWDYTSVKTRTGKGVYIFRHL